MAAFPISDYILDIFFLRSFLTFVRGFEQPDASSTPLVHLFP